MSEQLVPNRPCEAGRKIGAELARLTEAALAERKKKFPNHKEPCGTCAFRRGTIPNGCLATVMDAMKCAVEGSAEFMCHEQKGQVCTGFFILESDRSHAPQVKVPWKYSTDAK